MASFNLTVTSRIALCLGLLCLVGPGETVLANSPRPSCCPSDTTITTPLYAKKLLVRGLTEAALGDHTEAITYYEQALERVSQSPTLLQSLADAYAARGEYTTALFYARKARTHGTNRVHHHWRLAELLREAGQSEAALDAYRDLMNRFPDHGKAYRALARLQATLDRPQAALRTYETYVKRAAHPPVAVYRKMLSLYDRVGDPQGVRSTLQALHDRRPNNDQYQRRLALLYAEQGDAEAALTLLEPLAEAHPGDKALRRRLRQLYRKTGRTTAASAPTNTAPSLGGNPDHPDSLVARARSLYEAATAPPPAVDTSRLNRAAALLDRALEQAPASTEALSLRARLHEREGTYRTAGRLLQRALDENPRTPDRWARAAAAYLQAGYDDKAAAVAEEGLLLFPGRYRLARTAAVAHLRLENGKQALKYFREALDARARDSASSPERAALTAGLGLAHSHLGQPEKADEAFEEALSIAPDTPVALARYAYSLAQRGKKLDRALDMAKQAVDQAPGNPVYLDVLGWVYVQRGNLEAARAPLQKAVNTKNAPSRVFEHYGDLQHALGNDASARRYWQEALDRAPNRESLRQKLGPEANT